MIVVAAAMTVALLPAREPPPLRSVELGRIATRTNVQAVLELRNDSPHLLRIASTEKSCGCTKVVFPKDVLSGETARIPVEIEVGSSEGPMQWTVMARDDRGQAHHFALHAHVVEPWPQRADLGAVRAGAAARKGFVVKSVSGAPLEVELRQFDRDFFDAQVQYAHDRLSATILLAVKPGAPRGAFQKFVEIVHGERQRSAEVSIVGTVEGAVAASPAYLIFGSISAGEQVVRSCKILPTADAGVVVKSIVVPDALRKTVVARTKQVSPREWLVVVEAKNTGVKTEQLIRGQLELQCDLSDGGDEVLPIGFSAVFKAPPDQGTGGADK
jgi:hypothetical protein